MIITVFSIRTVNRLCTNWTPTASLTNFSMLGFEPFYINRLAAVARDFFTWDHYR